MRPNLSKSKLPAKRAAEQVVKDIRRATRRHFSAEDKIRIVLDGLRGEDSIAELCRKEGIAQSLYYVWSKEFMEAGKRRLAGDTARAATSDEVRDLRCNSRNRTTLFRYPESAGTAVVDHSFPASAALQKCASAEVVTKSIGRPRQPRRPHTQSRCAWGRRLFRSVELAALSFGQYRKRTRI